MCGLSGFVAVLSNLLERAHPVQVTVKGWGMGNGESRSTTLPVSMSSDVDVDPSTTPMIPLNLEFAPTEKICDFYIVRPSGLRAAPLACNTRAFQIKVWVGKKVQEIAVTTYQSTEVLSAWLYRTLSVENVPCDRSPQARH